MAVRWSSAAIATGSLFVLTACSSFPIASIPKGTVAGVSAGFGALLSGPTGALIAGTLGSIGGDMMIPEAAPVSDFWSLLGRVIEIGGYGLILIVLVPLILGWFLPTLKKKK